MTGLTANCVHCGREVEVEAAGWTELVECGCEGETMIFTQQITRGYDDAELERMNAEWARIVEAENLTPTTDAYYTRQDQFIDAVNHFSPRDVKNVRRPLRARDIPDDAQTYPE